MEQFLISDIPEDDQATFELLATGKTLGTFQLESHLGKHWCKTLKPENIEHIAALISILRPGCLNAKDEGKSVTQHYCDRKNSIEETKYLDPCLEPILKKVLGYMIYQENAMQVAQYVAGFSLEEADVLRKAAGKKLPKLMAELESKFMDGCKKEGKVSEEVAKQLWENIKASQRYSFNKSHAVSYGLTSYRTAYCKAHYPLEFYCAYLRGAEWKQHPLEEINALVNDAKLSGIKVELPDFRSSEPTFFIDGEVIRFGLGNIKQVGEASRDKLLTAIRDASDNTSWSWFKYLIRVADNISSTTNVALISCGALDSLGESRTRMLYELEIWDKVTSKEKEWIQGREFSTLTDALTQCASHKKFGGGCANEKRVNIMLGLVRMLENPPYELIDNPNWISWAEEKYLGVAISCNKVDACNEALKADATCQQFVHGVMPCAVLAVEVKKVKMVRTKNGENPGQKMAFLDIADSTATIEGAVCFPDKYRQHMNILYEGNTVLVQLERGNRGAIIKDCSQI